MATVEAYGIAKEYGALTALDDLTLTVDAGDVVGVLGPNGAGKTTAIRILTTILPPSRGSFSVDGVPGTRPDEVRRRIGVLPESSGYPERQTGQEYLRYHARLYGHGRASARAVATALLDEVGLAERGGSVIASYSRGMRQRLGLARALVNDPWVVFLDEPTLGLDPAGQRDVVAAIRRIRRERGAAVLLSTHLLNEVEDTCTRVLILNHGRVVADGTVTDVTRRAAAPRTGRLRVAPNDRAAAARAVALVPGVRLVEPVDGQSDELAVVFAPVVDDAHDGAPNDAVRAVVDAGIPLRSFELQGARLSDAFLALTEAAS